MSTNFTSLQTKLAHLLPGKKLGQVEQRPAQYWMKMVFLTTGIAIVLCMVGAYIFFMKEKKEEVRSDTPTLPVNTLTKTRVDVLLLRHQEEVKLFTEMRLTPPLVPSTGYVHKEVENVQVEEEVTEGDVPEVVPSAEENKRPELVP